VHAYFRPLRRPVCVFAGPQQVQGHTYPEKRLNTLNSYGASFATTASAVRSFGPLLLGPLRPRNSEQAHPGGSPSDRCQLSSTRQPMRKRRRLPKMSSQRSTAALSVKR
jgi:hypothetical protein